MHPTKYPPMTNLKWLRIAAAMRQKDLAAAVGVHRNQISSYETGRDRPSFKTLRKIARILRVSIDVLEEI